ncbi:hypothetical protein HDU67_004080 [Dinochytrium kinnereticum]|nr:hypothetical protein HDU67_004080 [Dinochytrium kinnereticum]
MEALRRLAHDTVQFWRAASMNIIADAFTMRTAAPVSTWDMIKETEAECSKQLELYITGKVEAGVQVDPTKPIHRFLCLAFFPKSRWRPASKKKMKTEDLDYMIGGCTTAQYFIQDRHIAGRFATSLGQFGFHPNSMIPTMVFSLFNAIQADVQIYSLPPPLYVWGFERTRKSLLVEVLRYGGRRLDEYCEASELNIAEMKSLLKDYIASEGFLRERDIYIAEWSGVSHLVRTIEGRTFFWGGLEGV